MTTERPRSGRGGHAAHRARRWAVGLSAGATVALTGVIAVATARQDASASQQLPAVDASTSTAPTTSATTSTKAPKSTAKKSTSTTTTTTTTRPKATTPATTRQPVARSSGSR